MKNHIGRTLLVLILFIHSLTSLASSQSKYTPLIRQVRGWPSEKILSKGDQFLQNKEEDKALVMYMLVCSRTNDRMTDEELTDCSLANLKVGDIFYARGNYINALENYQESLKLSETSASKTHLPLIYKNIGNVYCMFKDYGKGFDYYKKAYQIRPKNDNELTFRILANLFGVCINRKDLEGAKKYRQLLFATPRPNLPIDQFFLSFSTALMASQEARYAESNKILVNLADFCTRNKLPPTYICSAYAELYSNYQNLGDIDQAKHYISLCIDHAEREKMLHYIPETLRDMAQIQRKTGNATLAQQYERQYLSLMDSIYNSQRFNVVKNQQFMYEVDKTDKEITRLHQEEEIHRQNARLYQLLFLVSILAIVLVSMLLFYVVRQKQLLLDGIRRVMEETDEYCQPEFTVATLAKLIDSNERYVSMVVNDHFGKSFTEVLNDYRIKKACERLTTNNAKYAQLTIAAIGQSVGYKSQTTFVKQFRKCTGLTPSVYQKFVAEDRRNKETGA